MSNNSHSVNKELLEKFEFNSEVIKSFILQNEIPIDFYNKNGQILIHKKSDASEEDVTRLQKFESQGIYFLISDKDKFIQPKKPDSVNGREVSFTKLVNTDLTIALAREASDLLEELKHYPLNNNHIRKVQKGIDEILVDFKSSSDMELGLVNVIEVMRQAGVKTDSEIMTKRTVISMAMKLRGMKALSKADNEVQKAKQLNVMLASYMVDIGKARMKLPNHSNLRPEEYEYIKNHPIISYLMIGNLNGIDSDVKSAVLNSHRTFRGEGLNNNYPTTNMLIRKLTEYLQKYKDDRTKSILLEDIQKQIHHLVNSTYMDEDPGIISIAGEFASLSSDQDWRQAYDAVTSMKLILNNSFFSYNEKIVRDFFDLMALSLCENRSVLNAGDYIIVVSMDSQRKVHFETCVIKEIYRHQTRPLLERIGTIRPVITNKGKIKIEGYDPHSFRHDKRKAVFNLNNSLDPRRVIYVIDPELEPNLFEKVDQSYRGSAPRSVA
ncbi:c-di-GMP phosphodiesterase [Leptospira gomenensis]|uniref:C-di-GMP phosphodiesterase n=1 Tax=Leptospira gomenensis TaxID=2484974 RepID=A0A5F1Y6N6_9LEPT|nr:c-di-GMP phosphodiesterase [Leptospira gomenensis]TGK28127.1 c-di-GMP phosphodiesterase [Leptospira gomenensis]TGK37017.1 c-di-GMP phosphodiesterase [Leptospira gomenensis]TGK45653.1 c-di-GMP phosphodiesterase [Leptospira gomenensis]TGK59592.1 c-di-GMP phosphodiesterase [Leptospira gomenensis]